MFLHTQMIYEILKLYFEPKIFGPILFWTKNYYKAKFLGLNSFWIQNFLNTEYSIHKLFDDYYKILKHYFEPKTYGTQAENLASSSLQDGVTKWYYFL